MQTRVTGAATLHLITEPRTAVEMAGPWKAWKSNHRISTLSTAPWKSRNTREIPTFPQLRRRPVEKWKTTTRFPTFPPSTRFSFSNLKPMKKGVTLALRASRFQYHLALETDCSFSIILRLENAPRP
jgi:hypothetical protein